MGQTRLVVYTVEPLERHNQIFFQRLINNQRIDLAAVIVDRYHRSPWGRARFLLKHWGPIVFALSMAYQIPRAVLMKAVRLLWKSIHDRFVPPSAEYTFSDLEKSGVCVHYVDNINSPESRELIRTLNPDLCAILGGRIIQPHILEIPPMGTLNLHRHDALKYRGGAQTGYIERLHNETHVRLTVHYATARLDAGDILDVRDIPIERMDNAESLAVKSDYAGADLYYETLDALVCGRTTPQPQNLSSGVTSVTTPYWHRFTFWRPFRKALRKSRVARDQKAVMRFLRGPLRMARYALMLVLSPYLAGLRRRLEAQGRAPIVILYYHGLGNSGSTWRNIPMETFHAQVEYLSTYFKIISLEEAVRRLRSGKNYETAAVLTFDDGFENCRRNLAPYAQYFNIPATVFVCAGNMLHSKPLKDKFEVSPEIRIVSPEQLKEMEQMGVCIGSHGNEHEDMGSISGEDLKQAVQGSARTLAEVLGHSVSYFSFPYGQVENMSTEAVACARDMYDAVFSAYGGYNFPGDAGRFHFQRFANPENVADLAVIMNGLHRLKPFYEMRPEHVS